MITNKNRQTKIDKKAGKVAFTNIDKLMTVKHCYVFSQMQF